MSGYETARLVVVDGVATVTMNRPDALNALNNQLKADLAGVWREVASRDDVRSVLLTGEGRAFSSGGDIMQMDPDRGPEVTRQRMVYLLEEVVMPLAQLDKPVVAAVNGHAHGLGLSMALACDIVYAAQSAVMSFAFTRVGLAPDGGASYFLPRAVGLNVAKELMFTARRLSAEEAHDLGLVNRIFADDDLIEEATRLACKLAAGPPIAMGVTKRLLNSSLLRSLEDVAETEAYGQALAMSSEDHREGIKAFREKREPKFTGT
jgi:2-(1,2-epoxy-1,2-dihydrophenyl)acetyl-CoA isomerase